MAMPVPGDKAEGHGSCELGTGGGREGGAGTQEQQPAQAGLF